MFDVLEIAGSARSHHADIVLWRFGHARADAGRRAGNFCCAESQKRRSTRSNSAISARRTANYDFECSELDWTLISIAFGALLAEELLARRLSRHSSGHLTSNRSATQRSVGFRCISRCRGLFTGSLELA